MYDTSNPHTVRITYSYTHAKYLNLDITCNLYCTGKLGTKQALLCAYVCTVCGYNHTHLVSTPSQRLRKMTEPKDMAMMKYGQVGSMPHADSYWRRRYHSI